MEGNPQAGPTPVESPISSRAANAGSGLVAVVALLALLDAGVETLLSGSPLRWWIAPAVLVFAVLSVWLWLPGSWAAKRWSWPGAASWSVGGLLLLLAVTVWLPEGQTNGVRMFLQPTPRLLTSVLALAVLLAGFVLVRGVGPLPATPKLIARSVFTALALYALVSLGLALRDNTPFAGLFQGGTLWQRLPRWLQGTFLGTLVLVPTAVLVQILRIIGGLRRKISVLALLHQATALLMAFLMAFGGIALSAGRSGNISLPADRGGSISSSESNPSPLADLAKVPSGQEAADRLGHLFDALATAQGQIPRDTFDPKAVVLLTGGDPARLLAWVRDNTFWVPYRGTLRGPVGVLMDRLGNGVDRALLLGELLRTAGATVRLAHATLSEDEGRRLLSTVRPGPPDAAAATAKANADFERRIDQESTQYGMDPSAAHRVMDQLRTRSQRLQEDLTERVAEQAKTLMTALAQRPREEDARQRDAEAKRGLEAARDHWWIQKQEATGWIDLDPMVPEGMPGKALARATEMLSLGGQPGKISLDSRYCQEVLVRVVIEQSKAGKLTESVPLTHTFRPADLVEQPFVLMHVPLKWPANVKLFQPGQKMSEFEGAVLKQSEWLPMFVAGKASFSGKTFTDQGQMKDKPGGGAVGGLASGFGDLLGGGGSEPKVGEGVLSAEWLEYEIRVPGDAPRRIRRQIFDLLGPGARAAGKSLPQVEVGQRTERAFVLAGATEILLQVAALSSPFLDNQISEALQANRDVLTRLVGNAEAVTAEDIERMTPFPSPLLGLAHLRFAMTHQVSYIAAPNILSRHIAILPKGGVKFGGSHVVDIVANEVAVRNAPSAEPFESRVTQGVVDTNVETMIVARSNDPVRNISELARRLGPKGRWDLLTDNSTLERRRQEYPADVHARLSAEVAAGQWVVMPSLAAAGSSPPAWGWWRVNPQTGATLGIDELGRGGDATETAILTANTALSLPYRAFMAVGMFDVCILSSVFPLMIDEPLAPRWKATLKCIGVGIAGFYGFSTMGALTWSKLLGGVAGAFITGTTA